MLTSPQPQPRFAPLTRVVSLAYASAASLPIVLYGTPSLTHPASGTRILTVRRGQLAHQSGQRPRPRPLKTPNRLQFASVSRFVTSGAHPSSGPRPLSMRSLPPSRLTYLSLDAAPRRDRDHVAHHTAANPTFRPTPSSVGLAPLSVDLVRWASAAATASGDPRWIDAEPPD
ncbi:hypothetical protein B0H15DRAFT_486531 [Mycena belliarum]|uniref:Uncharacterized protein n=1 Tax=Mycena belliarum TaxID=1033014 RepID=A0AAD6U086_9AGAR|nr:hypothetical protein B0H15DRAFT_486531 [Mycena belliae]